MDAREKASSLVAIGIVVGLALIAIYYGGPGAPPPPGPDVLFEGAYTMATLQVTAVPYGTYPGVYLGATANVSVGADVFTAIFAQASGLTEVYGFVTDSRGFTFPLGAEAPGPLNFSNDLSAWGSADGNAEVAWTSVSNHTATIEVGSRDSQWMVASRPFPAYPNPCSGQPSPPVDFEGALWTETQSGCGSQAGGDSQWTVRLASGNSDSWGLGGPVQSACSLPSPPGASCPPTTDQFGWHDPEAPFGMAITNSQVLMLAMS